MIRLFQTRFWILLAALCLGTSGVARAAVTYDTKFVGVSDDLQDTLEQAAQLVTLSDKDPDSLSALHRRADSDIPRLQDAMHAAGYYDSKIAITIDPDKDPNSYIVTVKIDQGQIYTLGTVDILGPDGKQGPEAALTTPALIGLTIGGPALSAPIVAAEPKIVHQYAVHGFPYAKVLGRDIEIDVATKTMRATYHFDPGPRATFGGTAIAGLTTLDPLYVQRRQKWIEGAPYDQSKIDDTRQALVTTGLFGSVIVAPEGAVASDGSVPVGINLIERPLHSISAGAAYDTSLGIEGNVSWEDRDLFGYAEDLTVTALGGQSDSSLTAKFTRPDAIWPDQDFVTSISAANQLQEAFRSVNETVQIGFQQHFTTALTGGYSIEAEHARINEITDSRTYTLVGLPFFLRDNETDDLLNPSRGWRAGLDFTPYFRALGSNLTYLQAQITASTYQKIDDKGRYILALEGIVGGSCCASLDEIPKDHRLYAGGGGTVRGFAFQRAGPLDQYNNAIGGRSLLVTTAELRTRITDTIGLVPFLDAGSDYATPLPKLDQKLYVGAGIGLRYYTAIGPVRFDVATPINPHPAGDSPIQVYVSLGQSF